MNTKKLIDVAVSRPVEERALVLDSILQRLNQPKTEIEKNWGILAKKRLEEIESGKVETIPGNQVFEEIWKRF